MKTTKRSKKSNNEDTKNTEQHIKEKTKQSTDHSEIELNKSDHEPISKSQNSAKMLKDELDDMLSDLE